MKTWLTILCASVLLAAAHGSAAEQPLEMVSAILIGAESPGQPYRLVITGRHLNGGRDISLTLGGKPLTLLELSSTAILAEIPAELVPGRYVLIAWSDRGRVREASMSITIGAHRPAEIGPGHQRDSSGSERRGPDSGDRNRRW